MPRRPVSSRSPGVERKRSSAISRASAARSSSPVCTACTSSTARAAALEEATGAPATRSASQTTLNATAARSAQPRWPAATRVTRSSASTGSVRSAMMSTTATGDGEVRGRAAHRVAQRLDADPHVARVVDRLERPVERREEPDVEDLHEHEHAQQRSHDHGQHAARRGGQHGGHGDDDEQLEREPRERAEGEVGRLVRRDERGPHEQQGEDGDRYGGRADVALAAAPQPPRALADRRRERDERGDQERLRQRSRQDPGGRDRQHDPLRRRDGPAPAPPRQRRAHPRQQPLAGEEQVARRADGEHPGAVARGDVDAEREDQERVDLAVEARPQRGRRPGAPRHPAVGRVERERDGGERHEQRGRRVTSRPPARRRRPRAWPARA